MRKIRAIGVIAAIGMVVTLSGVPALAGINKDTTTSISGAHSDQSERNIHMRPAFLSQVSDLSVEDIRSDLAENGNAPIDAVAGIDGATNAMTQLETGRLLSNHLVDPKNPELQVASAKINSPLVCVGITWSAQAQQPVTILVRAMKDGQWEPWENLAEEVLSSADGSMRGSEPWVVIGATQVQAVVVSPKSRPVEKARVQIIDPGEKEQDKNAVLPEYGELFAKAENKQLPEQTDNYAYAKTIGSTGNAWTAVIPQGLPQVVHSREEWEADPSWLNWDPVPGDLKAAVIHHTAGANFYAPEQVPAILRSIYRYHAVTLGWGDIGYNVLVDNYGRAWQGREGDFWKTQVKGGHALGVNKDTFGISVLGEYGDFPPSQAAMDTVARVIAYKLRWAGLDPDGVTTLDGVGASGQVPVVMAHRDVPGKGGQTSCPGQAFYLEMPRERELVKKYMKTGAQALVEPINDDQDLEEEVLPVRLAGKSRIETAIAIAQQFSNPEVVYLARSDLYADALAAGSLTDGPVVLVNNSDNAVNTVQNYIARTKPKTVVALGGEQAVSSHVLKRVSAGLPTGRIAGSQRAQTSALIAKRAWETSGTMNKVYLAEQSKGIDALSAGAITDGPIMLVPSAGEVSQQVRATISALSPIEVIALGGEQAVSTQVLKQAAGKYAANRLAGADRYETSLAISRKEFTKSRNYYLANALNPVDAVAGGSLKNGPIVLVPPKGNLPSSVAADIARLVPLGITALGGPEAVSKAIIDQAIDKADKVRAEARRAQNNQKQAVKTAN